MNRLAVLAARVGNGWDAVITSAASTPRRVLAALAIRRYRRAGLIASILTLAIYLFAIGDLTVATTAALAPTVQLAPQALWQARAPYLFEPIAVVHPIPHLTVFVSPVNIVLGAILAALVGCNIAGAAHAAQTAVSCRRPGYSKVLAALPAFLMGFACCVPTFLLMLGSGVAAALLPVLLPLRPVFYPLAVLLLLSALVATTQRASPTA